MDTLKVIGRSAAGELAGGFVAPALGAALGKVGVPMASTIARFSAAAAGVYAAGYALGRVSIGQALVLGVIGTLAADALAGMVPVGPDVVKRAVVAGVAGAGTTWARSKIGA